MVHHAQSHNEHHKTRNGWYLEMVVRISSILNLLILRYSSIITLKKLACAITHALHEQQKYHGVFASAREIDDDSTACRVLKNSSRV